jgi:hypothetical protein
MRPFYPFCYYDNGFRCGKLARPNAGCQLLHLTPAMGSHGLYALRNMAALHNYRAELARDGEDGRAPNQKKPIMAR